MRLRMVIGVWALFPLLAFPHDHKADGTVVHGTINIALGNKNGLVVLTDSMLTGADGHQLTEPGQKLFKLDDHSVCAIAGFISAPTPVPDFNAATAAVIDRYIELSAQQHPQTISEKLAAISTLLRFLLNVTSNVLDVEGQSPPLKLYRAEIIVAGYDLDGKPKIAKGGLQVKRVGNGLESLVDEPVVSVIDNELIPKFNAMSNKAKEILARLQQPGANDRDPILQNYVDAYRKDRAASLELGQMVELAKRLAYYTAQVYREVGGANQIAIFAPAAPVKIEQRSFPPPDPSKHITNFALVVDNHFEGPRHHNDFLVPGIDFLYVRCIWQGTKFVLDDNFVVGSTFTNTELDYNSGRLLFDKSNHLTNSVLIIGPSIKDNDPNVRQLHRDYPSLSIQRESPAGRTSFYSTVPSR